MTSVTHLTEPANPLAAPGSAPFITATLGALLAGAEAGLVVRMLVENGASFPVLAAIIRDQPGCRTMSEVQIWGIIRDEEAARGPLPLLREPKPPVGEEGVRRSQSAPRRKPKKKKPAAKPLPPPGITRLSPDEQRARLAERMGGTAGTVPNYNDGPSTSVRTLPGSYGTGRR